MTSDTILRFGIVVAILVAASGIFALWQYSLQQAAYLEQQQLFETIDEAVQQMVARHYTGVQSSEWNTQLLRSSMTCGLW